MPPDAPTMSAEVAAPEAETSVAPDPDAGGVAEAVPEADAEPEMEVFYTFTWGGNRPARQGQRQKQGGKGKPRGKGAPRGKGKGDQKPKTFAAKPPKREKAIDPDNPFAAALQGFKTE